MSFQRAYLRPLTRAIYLVALAILMLILATRYIPTVLLAANSNTAAPDCSGTLISHGYNLLGDNTGCTFIGATGDQVGTNANRVDPQLGSLQDNGGPTPTRQLLPDSPATDAANPALPGSSNTACPIADQRGFQRPQGNGCDIGAYEVGRTYFLPLVQH